MDSRLPEEMRWLYREVRPFLRWHVGSFSCISSGSVLSLLAPLVLKWLIDVVLPAHNTNLLLVAVGLIFLCYQGRAVLVSVAGYLTVMSAQRLALDLRRRLVKHLDGLSADYHETTAVGASIYPLKEPVDEIAYFGSDLVPFILRTVVAALLTTGTMLILSPQMTFAVLPLIPAFLVTRRRYRHELENESDRVQRDQAGWSNFLQEHLTSIIAIQLLRKERRQEREAFRLLGSRLRSLDSLFRTSVSFTFYTSLTVGLAMAATIGYGGWKVFQGTSTVGGLVAFYTYLTQLFEPLSGIAETYVRTQKIFASIRQVRSLFAVRPAVTNHPAAVAFPDNNPWTIDFAGVQFRYPGNRGQLSIPSLHIGCGEIVAIAGDNGAGKSTLAKLLARFYDPEAGCISIGGHDIRRIRIDSLREHVCFVPPQPVLLDTTISNNLQLGRKGIDKAELVEVLEHVGLSAWIPKLFEDSEDMLSNALGVVDAAKMRQAVEMAGQGHEISLVALMRAIGLEFWLRSIESSPKVRVALASQSST